MNGEMGRFDIERITAGTIIDAAERAMSSEDIEEREDSVWLLDHLVCLHNTQSERTEVLPEKVVKPDDAFNEGRRGGGVHDAGDREIDAGRKFGRSILGSIAGCCESFDEKLAISKAIRVEEGVVVGNCVSESCCMDEGGVSLFGFHADYFTKFETPGWFPRTRLDYAMTSIFAEAMLGRDKGKRWLNHNRMLRWKGIDDGFNAA